jgi:hypothetical protein
MQDDEHDGVISKEGELASADEISQELRKQTAPPRNENEDAKKGPHQPRADHPWRRRFKKERGGR